MKKFTKNILLLGVLLAFTARVSASLVVDTACQYSITTISQAGTGTWSSLAGNPAATTIASPTSGTTTVSGFTVSGLYGYVWLTGGTHDTVEVFIKPKPNAGPDQTICQYSTSYITMAAAGTGIWSALTTNPTPVAFTVPISPITTVIGADSLGVYGFVWLSGGCTDTVFVTITAKPDAGPNQTICAATTATMAATGTGVWSALTTNPSASTITTPTSPTTTITGLISLGGTYGFVWTSPNGCTDTAYLYKPYASPQSMSVCIDSSPVMTILSTGPGIWLAGGANPGTSSVVNNSSPVTRVGSFSVQGTYTYDWLSNGCSVTVTIIVTGDSNDLCVNAVSFGTMPTPTPCAGGTSGYFTGASVTLSGTNLCATASTPYPYASPCPINPYSPPLDVWYTFVATGNTTIITVSGGTNTLTNPTITVWSGGCASLQALGCTTGSGGTATLTILQTIIGQTYLVQIAGEDGTQSGNFTVTAHCDNNCASCIEQAYITASPPPVNGAFNPGETVMFCYTVTSWGQSNANWLHGVSVIIGSGWNLASLVIDSTPLTCMPGVNTGPDSTFWEWLPSCTGATSGITWGIGWYFNNYENAPFSPHTNPGDNYGDPDAAQSGCDPTFCLSLTANPGCIAGNDLSIGFHATGDNQSGNWSAGACPTTDTNFMYTVGSCCPPLMASSPAICHQADGLISATPIGNSPPYIFHWSTGQTDTINSNNPDTIFSLLPGNYTVTVTNAQHCVSTAEDSVTEGLLPDGGPPQYVSCPSIVDSVVMGGSQGPTDHGIWSAVSTNPAPTVIADVNSPTTAISGFSVLGTYYYVWTLNGCTDTVPVIVSSHPNAGGSVSTCLNGTATMAATGTGTWSPLPGNSSPTSITNPNNPNTTITGFSVAGGTYGFVWSQYICSDTTYVLIPIFTSSVMAQDTAICKFLTTTLSDTASPPALGPFTFSWSPPGGVVSPSSATTLTTPLLRPTMFYVTVSNAGGCVRVDSVFVDMAGAAPLISVRPSRNGVCPGDTVALNGNVIAENLEFCGMLPVSPGCPANSVYAEVAVTNDTFSSSSGLSMNDEEITPFAGSNNAFRAQYLFRASELQAAGLSSGIITDISFFVKQINTFTPFDSFTISIGCTNQDSLTDFISGLSEVFFGAGPFAVSPSRGWTPLPFTNSLYGWDGASNLVLQVCYTNPAFSGTNDDDVAYTTTSWSGSSVYAASGFFGSGGNGCGLTVAGSFPSGVASDRPNIKFGTCAPNVLTYQWSPHTLLCDTCPNTAVIVTSDSTYTLSVNDNGCSNTGTGRVVLNTAVAMVARPDTTLCGADTVQLSIQQLNPAVSQCVQGYTLTSVPYNPLSGTPTAIDGFNDYLDAFGFSTFGFDGTAGPYSMGFSFPFYCQSYSQVYVNTNGWVSFVDPYPLANPTTEYTAEYFPPTAPYMDPMKMVAFVYSNWDVYPSSFAINAAISYFVTGVAPNQTFVIVFTNIEDQNFATYHASGQIQLHQNGVIDILISSDDYTVGGCTVGIKDSTGLGMAPVSRDLSTFTVTTPEQWEFTPQNGPASVITGTVWSPNTFISNDTITNPLAYPPSSQTYIVTSNILINQFSADSSTCRVTDTVTIAISPAFAHTLTAVPPVICPGDSSQLTFLPAGAGTTFHWSPANVLNNDSISDPIASVTDTTAIYVTATNSFGCSVQDTVTVNTYPVQHPSIGPNVNVCYTDSVPLSTPGSYSTYQWYLVDTVNGSTTAINTTASIYGHPDNYYLLKVLAAGSSCYYYTDTVHVDSFPRQTIAVISSGPDTFCIGSSVVLQVSLGIDTTSIMWTPSAFASHTSFAVSSSGLFSYTAMDLNGCTLFSDTIAVSVTPAPVITISSPRNVICNPGGIDTLTAIVAPAGVPLYWINSTGTQVATGSTLITSSPDVYEVHTASGCADSASFSLAAALSPVVTLPASFSLCNCTPDTTVTAIVTPPSLLDSYLWSDGSSGPGIVITTVGVHPITVMVTDTNNCTASASMSYTISCIVLAPYATPDTVSPGQSFLLVADSVMQPGLNYTWSPDSNFTNASADSVSGMLNVPGTDSFHIFAIDPASGCSYTSAVTITVLAPGNFAMADAFTPNGDGMNDYFFPVFADSSLTSAKVKAFRIYDRWGQTVYDNPTAPGWDGNLKGIAQPSDVYIYFVTIESPDPNNPAKTIQKSVEGTVELFR